MKKPFIIFLVVIFTIVSCTAINVALKDISFSGSPIKYGKVCIVIDAGHGGKDAGTLAADGTNEKDINLSIALSLYDYFKVCGISSCLTRNGDYELYNKGQVRNRSDLYNRLDYVNSVENAILISIHQNHFEDTSEYGMQVWYSANTAESKIIADNILHYDKYFLQPQNSRENKVSDNSYYILYRAKVPSVMVECGFMSNVKENELLKNQSYQRKISYCILLGINDYISEE